MVVTAPINRCFEPIRLRKGSDYHFYDCGKCPSCLSKKQSKIRNILDHESNNQACTLFITLTYDNYHLPKVWYDPLTKEILAVTATKFDRHKRPYISNITSEFSHYPNFKNLLTKELLYEGPVCDIVTKLELPYYDFKLPHYVTQRSNNSINFDNSNCFAISYQKDFQDFIKRLRANISRTPELNGKDTYFSYFVCSEYGPKTFRPHYHALLFFRDVNTARLCHSRLVNESWLKSNLPQDQLEKQCEFVQTGTGASSYVSKYVTKSPDLPPTLLLPPFSTFTSRSKKIPLGSSAIPCSSIPDTLEKTDILYHHEYIDKDTHKSISVKLPYPSSLWSRYFPKPLFSRFISPSDFSHIINRIYQLPSYNSIPNLTELFNSLTGYGSLVNSNVRKPSTLYLSHFYPKYLDLKVADLVFGLPNLKTIQFTSFDLKKITYQDTFSYFFDSHNNLDLDRLDLFLFGIPQNRTFARKILRLRDSNQKSSTSWATTPEDYLYYYNLYHTKTFSNQLKSFYENLELHNSYNPINPSILFEYYPSLYYSLPTSIDAINKDTYEKIDTILSYRYNLSILDFYNVDNTLINFSFRKLNRYSLYRTYLHYKSQEFETKRLHYYNKHLNS